jgi:hypothetical protein
MFFRFEIDINLLGPCLWTQQILSPKDAITSTLLIRS